MKAGTFMNEYNGGYIFPPRTKMKSELFRSHKAANGLSPIAALWSRFPNTFAQLKLNGNRNIIKVNADRSIEFWNRHEGKQDYVVTAEMREEILRISPEGTVTVWDSELMDKKFKGIKDVIYLYDVLVWEGKHNIGMTYGERYALLSSRVAPNGNAAEYHMPLELASIERPMYLAQNYVGSEWAALWVKLQELWKAENWDTPWIEGLVAKRFDAVSQLQKGNQEYNNSGFMCRFRRPHKNYRS
jgi:hypothetical protein